MKVLLDSTSYTSELIGGNQPLRVLRALEQCRAKLFISELQLDELFDVLNREFDVPVGLIKLFLQKVAARSILASDPLSRHRVHADPKDGHILRAAVEAGVDYLVSNDKRLLRLHPYEGIEILSLNQFERLLRDQGLLK